MTEYIRGTTNELENTSLFWISIYFCIAVALHWAMRLNHETSPTSCRISDAQSYTLSMAGNTPLPKSHRTSSLRTNHCEQKPGYNSADQARSGSEAVDGQSDYFSGARLACSTLVNRDRDSTGH
jgi:hypothetical protein